MGKLFMILGSLNAFLSVALGAFGAHALKSRVTPELLDIYETAVRYHLPHALALLIIGILLNRSSEPVMLQWSGWLIFAGIIIFCGSLYVLGITGIRWLGAVTPLGGLAFLGGWLLLTISIFKYF
jgi:uncharacterized membrane protein YgdD (TMEM256/DUF423 family)